MDDLREKYKNGTITKLYYKNMAIEKTLQSLHSSGYNIINNLGSGSFGTVIKVKEPNSSTIVALKIALYEDVSIAEKTIWPTLSHTNIIPLISQNFFKSNHTIVFKMPLHPYTLNKLLSDANFRMNFRALQLAIFWLEGITSGLSYLHEMKCYHLDVKWNNILVSASNSAVICDFTFLTKTEDFVTNYGSPKIFKAPETVIDSKQRRPVDGGKYDVYTLGLLALEMFSGMSFSEEISKQDLSKCKKNYWCELIYPCVFSLLVPPIFLHRMQIAFPTSQFEYDTVDNIRNLIVSCLNLNPADRPSADQLLEGKLFEGEKFWPLSDKDIWNAPAKLRQVEKLIKTYRKKEDKRHRKLKKIINKDKKCKKIAADCGVIESQLNNVDCITEEICDSVSVKKTNDAITTHNVVDLKEAADNFLSENSRKIVLNEPLNIKQEKDFPSLLAENVVVPQQNTVDCITEEICDSVSVKKTSDATTTHNVVDLKEATDNFVSENSRNTVLNEPLTIEQNLKHEDVYIGSVRSINTSLNETLATKETKQVAPYETVNGVLKINEKNEYLDGFTKQKNDVLGNVSVTNLQQESDKIGYVNLTHTLISVGEMKKDASIEAKNSELKMQEKIKDVVSDSKIFDCASACKKDNASATLSGANVNQVEDETGAVMLTKSNLNHSLSIMEQNDNDPKTVKMTTKSGKNKGRIMEWFRGKRKSFSRVLAIFRPKKKGVKK